VSCLSSPGATSAGPITWIEERSGRLGLNESDARPAFTPYPNYDTWPDRWREARPRARAETNNRPGPLPDVASRPDAEGDPGEARTGAGQRRRAATDVKARRSAARRAGRHEKTPTRINSLSERRCGSPDPRVRLVAMSSGSARVWQLWSTGASRSEKAAHSGYKLTTYCLEFFRDSRYIRTSGIVTTCPATWFRTLGNGKAHIAGSWRPSFARPPADVVPKITAVSCRAGSNTTIRIGQCSKLQDHDSAPFERGVRSALLHYASI